MTFLKFPISMLPVIGRISKNETRMLLAIMRWTHGSAGQCWASVETLSSYTGMSRPTGQAALSKLIKAGIVERDGRRLTVPDSQTGVVDSQTEDGVVDSQTEVSGFHEKGVWVSHSPKDETHTKMSGKPGHNKEDKLEKEKEKEKKRKKRAAPAPVATEAQELWDHWRKLNPKIRKKEPPQDQTRHLSAALDCFTVAELKQALNGVNPMVATWSSPRPPQFKFAFTKLDKDAGKTAFVEERVHEAIGHYQNAAAERVKPQMEAAIKRSMATEDTPSDGPKTHKGRKVLGWFAATDSTGAKRFKWAKLAEYDDGVSCKRAFALRAMLENTENPAARQLIETALVDADWRVRDAISIDDQRAKDRQRAEEKRKRMEAEYEAAGCPIYEVEELPF